MVLQVVSSHFAKNEIDGAVHSIQIDSEAPPPVDILSENNHPPKIRPAVDVAIDLKKEYPITFRRAFKKAFWVGMIALGIGAISYRIFHGYISALPEGEEKDFYALLIASVNLIAVAWWASKVAYYQVERATYRYNVAGGNLYLSKGLITRDTGSFPLSRITDIYLHRGIGDFFWGLASLHISTPTMQSGQFAYIHGLTIRNAENLRSRLESLVESRDGASILSGRAPKFK